MSKQNVNFKVGTNTDLDDLFVRKSLFVRGGVWSWGTNTYGGLGDNSTTNRSSPVQTVFGGINWKQIDAGIYHSCGLKTDGTLWLWGLNTSGELGINSGLSKSSPVQTISGGTNWFQISCGANHTAAIKTDGSLWLWGLNTNGQLGDNSSTSRSSPVQSISTETNWKQVSCGANHTAAIKTDGTLWLWGYNIKGELGDNSTTNRSSPVQTVAGETNWKQVACGSGSTIAIKTDGTLWSWGDNTYGELGDNTSVSKSSPVQTVSGGTNWKYVSFGTSHAAGIKTDGTLWLWGWNPYGNLGDNSTFNKSSPVQTVSGGTNWKQVSCGLYNSGAIKTDGSLWVWGSSFDGELGDNTTVGKSSPVQTVAGGTNWKEIQYGFWSHGLAIQENY